MFKQLRKLLNKKIGSHVPCRYSMSIIWAFDILENKHILYHGKKCMKEFCNPLREHAANVINFEKKKRYY